MGKQHEEETPGFRPGMDKKKIMKSMTDKDWERIEEQQAFGTYEKGSVTMRVALQNDTVRKEIEVAKENIKTHVNRIRSLVAIIHQNDAKMISGKMGEHKNGLPIIKEELLFDNTASELMIKDELRRIPLEFAELRQIVGCTDLMKNQLLTIEDWEQLVADTEKEVKRLGYEIFDKEMKVE